MSTASSNKYIRRVTSESEVLNKAAFPDACDPIYAKRPSLLLLTVLYHHARPLISIGGSQLMPGYDKGASIGIPSRNVQRILGHVLAVNSNILHNRD